MRLAGLGAVGVAGVAAAAVVALGVPPASAVTRACVTGDGGHCSGLITGSGLELAVRGDVHTVAAGRGLVGAVPAVARAQDWDLHALMSGSRVFEIRWAPFGVPGGLCVTAVRDLPGRSVRLERCVPGTAGSSHQDWRLTRRGLLVNQADGLVLAAKSRVPGSPVLVVARGNGRGANKTWSLRRTSP